MKKKILYVILIVLLLASIGANVFFAVSLFGNRTPWACTPEVVQIMEEGAIQNLLEFRDGEDLTFFYDFDNEKYAVLREKYDLKAIAKTGSEFQQARNLMNCFSDRLTHYSSYNDQLEMNALFLLEYSLDQKDHGINCRAKAQIFNEMYLSLGIYARKVWLLPLSVYDTECHVVNEIWDSKLEKWVMLDTTNNTYWVDGSGNLLSILEIRENIANRVFCTPVVVGQDTSDLEAVFRKNYHNYLYIAKNMAVIQYLSEYSVGEAGRDFPVEGKNAVYVLTPANMDHRGNSFLSVEAVLRPPVEKEIP